MSEGIRVNREAEIQQIIDRESQGYENEDVDLLLSVYHPDMVWAWPPHSQAHDPMEWVLRMGRYNEARWRVLIERFFATHTLIHNHRVTRKIVLSEEQDGAFAVVDIDTLWHREGQGDTAWHDGTTEEHVIGRACKIYTLVNGEWKMLYQPGTMLYPISAQAGGSESGG